ncbi:MAG: hypothetical protein V4754_17390 [Pseudomonadota bacterium]
MSALPIVSALTGMLALGLDVWASVAIGRDDLLGLRQRWMQLTLVWLLPFFGAILVMAVRAEGGPPSRSYRDHFTVPDEYDVPGRHGTNPDD